MPKYTAAAIVLIGKVNCNLKLPVRSFSSLWSASLVPSNCGLGINITAKNYFNNGELHLHVCWAYFVNRDNCPADFVNLALTLKYVTLTLYVRLLYSYTIQAISSV